MYHVALVDSLHVILPFDVQKLKHGFTTFLIFCCGVYGVHCDWFLETLL